jgi:hypothetical protein
MGGSKLGRTLCAGENTKKTGVFMLLKKKTPCFTAYSRVESADLHFEALILRF